MKIQGGAAPAASTSSYRAAAAGGGVFQPGGAAVRATPSASSATTLAAINSLDALLALQETPSSPERRRRAVKRAGKLLDVLDALKLALLDGSTTLAMLQQLQAAVEEDRGGAEDARLQGVLDEIEVRAAVELAKQQMSRSDGGTVA